VIADWLLQWRHLLGDMPTRALGLTAWLFVVMAVLAPLERARPLHRQRLFRADFNLDLGYYFLGGILPAYFLVMVSGATQVGQSWLAFDAGSWVRGLPFALQLAMVVVLGELLYYWAHRWSHEIPWLWRFHAIHHSPRELDWLVNTRAHPLDLVFSRALGTAALVLLGLAHGAHGRELDLVAAVAIFNTAWGFFIHANTGLRLGYLEQLVTTPAFHHWHHANDSSAVTNKNYAALLPWMDRMFGTYHMPAGRYPARYGIGETLPGTLWAQLALPFRRDTAVTLPGIGRTAVEVDSES